jgi:TRAP-type C4-dicarboxylate transport system substrate-binding protein
MVGKMKAGQLDGSAVTAVGLSKIYKPILALQMPGLFTSWAKLDNARDVMKGEFEKGAKDAGFAILGWGDIGAAHVISKGFAVKAPEDIKGKKPYMWRDDAVAPVLFQVIGGITPVPLNVPEVLPNLNTGAVNLLTAPALAAEQLQWASKLDTIVEDTAGLAIGALVLSSKRLDALPEDLRTILLDTGKIAANALTKRIRTEDDAAFARMKSKMTVIKLSADERAKWEAVFKQTRQRLAQGTFSPDLVAKLEGLAK